MSSRKNKIGDLDSNSDLESILQKLTLGITELQQTVSNLTVNVDNIERRTKVVDNEAPISMPGQQNIQQNVSSMIPITDDRRYIENWSGLEGSNLTFYPNSKMHPMMFLNKLNNILKEAGVPDVCKKGLALACLKGTAADWGSIKGDSFTTYEDFGKALIDRFWGVEKQRELFLELTYGRFESGQAASKRGKYVYFDQLLFLLPTMEDRTTVSGCRSTQKDDSGSEDESQVIQTDDQSQDDDYNKAIQPTPSTQSQQPTSQPGIPTQSQQPTTQPGYGAHQSYGYPGNEGNFVSPANTFRTYDIETYQSEFLNAYTSTE
ncbi:hypothetical protein JTB14_028181 [Gonioctena quinquepunctata]|nr:hypothetical protein JTB14_028181 [Gonioctena quinquepunctata]